MVNRLKKTKLEKFAKPIVSKWNSQSIEFRQFISHQRMQVNLANAPNVKVGKIPVTSTINLELVNQLCDDSKITKSIVEVNLVQQLMQQYYQSLSRKLLKPITKS